MNILFLDLASNRGTLACVTEKAVVRIETIDHRIDDAELTPMIGRMLTEAGWSYKDLMHIACVTGPGGFTSLRVAAAAANALAYSLDIPVAGIHLSDLYRLRVTGSESRVPATWLHSTKKREVFIREPGADISGIRHATLEELPSILKPGTWTGELLPEQEQIVTSLRLTCAPLSNLEDVLPDYLASLTYKKETLLPWYGRGW